jgi:PAS domain S-box-containing protein
MTLWPTTLRVRLAAVTLALALLPALLSVAVMWRYGAGGERARVQERNEQLARVLAGEVEQFLEARRALTEETALVADLVRSSGTRSVHAAVSLHLRSTPLLGSVLLLDGRGRVYEALPPDSDAVGLDLSRAPYVREALESGRATWSSTQSLHTGRPVLALAVPHGDTVAVSFPDRKGLDGVIGALGLDRARTAAIVGRDAAVVAASDTRLADQHAVLDVPPVRAGLAGRVWSTAYRLDGKDWLGSSWPVRGSGWTVLVSEPLEGALASMRRLQLVLVLAGIAFAVLAAGAAVAVARRVVRPVEGLVKGIRGVAAGAYPRSSSTGEFVAVTGYREVDDLADAFRTMAAAVSSREEALARSERSYRQLVDNSLVGVGRTRLDGTVVFCNEAMARLYGAQAPEELIGTDVRQAYADPVQREELMTRLRDRGKVTSFEILARGIDLKERTLVFSASLDAEGVTVMALDISELKRAAAEREQLERQLQHSQKLEAVGRLAGGVAHDFNNLLTAIVGFAAMLKEELDEDDPRREGVNGILQSANRASHLTRSLLAYSRKQFMQPRPVDLCEAIRTVDKLLHRIIGEDVELVLDLPRAGLPAVADPGQLEQVLVNLCTNARDAMPGGGTLRLAGEEVTLSAAEAARRELPGEGRYVRIRVSDTGRGVSPEVMAHVFEPFYTTKSPGSGTGLGLSIVYGIVRQHGGHVELESELGKGTTVSLLFRRYDGPIAVEAPAPIRQAPRGRETLLLAEDEPLVRQVLRRALEGAGYAVIEASDGEEAVAQFAAHRGRIALCLLDVVMPRKNGREAAEAIRAMVPQVPILLASGYAADVLEERGHGGSLHDVIAKPIAPAELLQRVRERLDRVPG